MDLSAPIVYNGLTCQPATPSGGGVATHGIEVKRANFSSVGTDYYLDDRAEDHGVDAADVYLRQRTIAIEGAVYGTSKGQMWDDLQAVLAAFNPAIAYAADTANIGFRELTFRQPTIDTTTWTAGYIPLQFYARPMEPPAYSLDRVRTADDGRGLSIPWSVRLLAKDPRKYLQSNVSVNISTTAQSVAYRGDFPAWPIMQVTITSAGSSAATFALGSSTLWLDLSGAYDSTKDGGANLLQFLFSTRTLKRLSDNYGLNGYIGEYSSYEPFSGGILRVGTPATGISSTTFTYREAWA